MSIDRSSTTRPSRAWLWAAVGLLVIVAGLAAAAVLSWRDGGSAVPAPLALSLQPLDELRPGRDDPFGLALAPDGRRLAVSAAREGVTRLWLRDLSRDDLQPLAGTEGGSLPFWSPDGATLGYFADGKMRVFVFADGAVRDLADAPAPRGAVWHARGDILFASGDGGLMRRFPDGRVEPFTTLESGLETSHRHPQLTSDGAHVLFYVQAPVPIREGIWIAPFDAPETRKRLVKSDAHGLAIAGAVVYSSEGALVAQTLDPRTLALGGRPILIGTPVGRGAQNQLFATTGGDVLLFAVPASRLRQLRWVDRAGMHQGLVGEPMEAAEVRVAPFGNTVAVTRLDAQLNTLDIWAYEDDRPVPRRLSLAIDADTSPAWSRDGRRLAWATGRRAVTVRDALAADPEITLRKFDHPVLVTDWSQRDWIIVAEARPGTRSDIVVLPADEGGEPRTYAQSPFNETFGVVSPDGRWMAYASDESGRFEIYLDSFPFAGQRARLTMGGGTEPRWGEGGAVVFFRRGSELHAVRPSLAGGRPEALSSERLFDAGAEIRSFDVSPDGQRFLLNVAAPDSDPRPMTVIANVSGRLAELQPKP